MSNLRGDPSESDEAGALGSYVLPGRVSDPRPALAQAIAAEDLGLGSVWVSERWDTKEVGSLCGALGNATTTIGIVAGLTHFGTRHPLVLAAMGTTMQALTGGRFTMGFGRQTPEMWTALGVPVPTNAAIADYAEILRRLWTRETVTYSGPAGNYPELRMADPPEVEPPRMLLAAIGPRGLALAGRCFDGVVLHPFLTSDGVARSREIVQRAAEAAGRDPATVTVHAVVVVAPDVSPEEEAAIVGGRAVTYFQIPGYGDRLAEANGWDLAPLARLRSDPQLAVLGGRLADQSFTRQELVDVSRNLPEEWLSTGAVVGSAARCAERLREYQGAGADEIVLHGATADAVRPLVEQFRSRNATDPNIGR